MVLYGKSEDGLKVMAGHFVEVCRRNDLRVNSDKSMVMELDRYEGCEILVDNSRLEHVSVFKYLGCVLDETDTDGAKCCRNIVSGRKIAGAIRSGGCSELAT